jgi:hypothetical protein
MRAQRPQPLERCPRKSKHRRDDDLPAACRARMALRVPRMPFGPIEILNDEHWTNSFHQCGRQGYRFFKTKEKAI